MYAFLHMVSKRLLYVLQADVCIKKSPIIDLR